METRRSSMKTPETSTVRIQSWAGVRTVPVEIIGETPKCYRVRVLAEASRWPGRNRFVEKGDVRLVPKHYVQKEDG